MLIDFRELFPKYNINPQGVLHVGANRGEEYPVYMELGITHQIWIEANPRLMFDLKKTIFNNWGASAYCFAAGDEDKEEVTLHLSNNAGQSSSILELGTHKIAHPDVTYVGDTQVPMFRIDSYFTKEKLTSIDFLNVDVQGAELKVLKGMGTLLEQFKWAYLEVNKEELYKGCALVGEIDEYLYTYGFERAETYNKGGHFDRLGWSDALYIKR